MELIVFTLAVVAYLFFHFCHNWRPEPWPKNHFKLPPYQVHRGYWREGIQENTIEAFREARRRGAAMVELDVQLSKDSIPVVFHDEDLKRLGNSTERLTEVNAAELKERCKIPSLEEVLADPEGPEFFNIELKTKERFSSQLEWRVAEVVRKAQADSRIIFSSFNPMSLHRIANFLPEVLRALLVTTENGSSPLYLRDMWLGKWSKAHLVNLDQGMVNDSLMRRLSERKIPVVVWTVNDPMRAEILRNRGVVSIISDLEKI